MLYAGIDASGTPDLNATTLKHDPYVVVIACVRDVDLLRTNLSAARTRFGMKADTEFHAHNMPEEFSTEVLATAELSGVIIGAHIVDKAGTRSERQHNSLPSPNEVQQTSPIRLLEVMVMVHEFTEIRFDEEIEGKRRQQVFITEVKRVHRTAWPQSRIRVMPSPSHKSDLIQVADAVAYGLGKFTRGAIKTQSFRQRIGALMAHEAHTIIGPNTWEW